MKTIASLLLIALIVGSNGCMTAANVERAKGYTNEPTQPLKGDTVFLHGDHYYVIRQKQPAGKEAEKLPPTTPQGSQGSYYAFKPCLGCYVFTLATVPLDIVTSPFQLIGLGVKAWFLDALGRTP